eukprot:614921_1
MDKTLAIRFTVPAWYTVDDVLNDLNKIIPIKDNPRKCVQVINIDTKSTNAHCFVLFSSIYYFTHYITNAKHDITILPSKWPIYPLQSFQTICTNANKEHIKLYGTTDASYLIYDSDSGAIYISTMISNQEVLLKICNGSGTMTPSTNTLDALIIDLNEPCQLYSYHMNECDVTQTPKQYYTQSKGYYNDVTAWNMNTDTDAPLHILSPVFAIRQSINAALMFTNKFSLSFTHKILNLKHICDEWNGDIMDIDVDNRNNNTVVKNESIDIKYTDLDWDALYEEIKSTFVWLSVNRTRMIFPFLARLFDFKNPSLFAMDKIKAFGETVDDMLDEGTTNWLMERAILAMTNMDTEELEQRRESLEDKYENGGFDIDDEEAMPPTKYNVQLHKMQIVIREADADISEHKEWKAMMQVSPIQNNYVVSFINHPILMTMRERMIKNGFRLFEHRNELMHCLKKGTNPDCIQYGATMLTNPLYDDKFVDYYKKIAPDCTVDTTQNGNSRYIIYEPTEPPRKKQKIDLDANPFMEAVHSSTKCEANQDISTHNGSKQSIETRDDKASIRSPLNRIPKKTKRVYPHTKHSQLIVSKAIRTPPSSSDDEPIIPFANQIQAQDEKEAPPSSSDDEAIVPSADDDIAPIVSIPIVSNINNDHALPRSFSVNHPTSTDANTSDTVKIESHFGEAILEANKPLKRPKRKLKPKPKPMSFTTTDNTNNTELKPQKSSVNRDTKIPNLSIDSSGVGWAFGVPIYNEWYFDCADLVLDGPLEYNREFADLVVHVACRTDLEIVRTLRARPGRAARRTIKRYNQSECGFLKDVYSPVYRDLFMECFTLGDDAMDIDLHEFVSHEKLQKRGFRKYIIYEAYHGIKEGMGKRLYLLLKIYVKHITIGCVLVPPIRPPWSPLVAIIVETMTKKFEAIDLTAIEDNDEDEDDDLHNVEYKNVNYGNVSVKMEIESYSD